MRISIVFGLLLLIIDSCIEQIHIEAPDVSFQLAVDAGITDEPGPYTVNIFKASNLDADLDRRIPVSLAKVSISDDAGNVEVLKESSLGVYQTNAVGIQGVVGRTYILKIITKDGKSYESLPEKLNPTAAIEELYYEFEYGNKIRPDGTVVSDDRFNVYMNANSLPEGENLYRWKWTGTYETESFPYLKTKNVEGGPVPDPFPCSGFEVRNAKLFQAKPCECCTCWITMFQSTPKVSDDQFIKGNKFNNVKIAVIPVTRRTFYYERFHVNVKQMSLSRSAFNFWRVVQAQKEGAASLFQPPSGKVRGNIFSIDRNEEVQGIFYASSVKEKSIFIEKRDVPYTVKEIDTLKTSCKFLGTSTTIKPSFWR